MQPSHLPYLSSLTYNQVSAFTRHVFEQGLMDNAAYEAMLRDDILNMRRTLDRIEQELDKECDAHKGSKRVSSMVGANETKQIQQ
jgi:hypothetical protein